MPPSRISTLGEVMTDAGRATGLLENIKQCVEQSNLASGARSELLSALHGIVGAQGAQVRGVYLRSVTVQGFRGIGPTQMLQLKPGPGLTVITGRNGSGKSSFSEAIEVALTGRNRRWEDEDGKITQPIQQGGWRNLHEPERPRIDLELLVSGQSDPVTITRTWSGPAFTDSIATVAGLGDRPVPLSALGWEGGLRSYRPILAYSELGQMTTAKPSRMYDALNKLLGLGPLAEAYGQLAEREKELSQSGKQADAALPGLREALAQIDDERAREATDALASRIPDRERVRVLVAGAQPTDTSELGKLYRLVAMAGPDLTAVADAVARLRETADAAEDARSSRAGDARVRAKLLEDAIQYRNRHVGDRTCPVCNAPDRLTDGWSEQAADQAQKLREEAAEAEAVQRALRDARNDLLALIDNPPAFLPDELQLLWEGWAACREARDPAELASLAEMRALALAGGCRRVREEAAKRLAAQDERWRGVAPRLAAWLDHADAAHQAKPALRDVKKAKDWLRKTQTELRDERMRSIAEMAQEIWHYLCQESNVSLGAVELTGSDKYTGRGVQLGVTVDDAQAHALAVVSQGELFSLALALFLPRATASESPFGFIVIDDPVQSMDPRKVEGLARLLARFAETRQVVVFSHDSRLTSALRFHRIAATVLEVGRHARSVVSITTADDPVERELTAARATAKNFTEIGRQDVLNEVLPGQCRLALEAALQEAAWRNLLGAGMARQYAQDLIENAKELIDLASLALFQVRRDKSEVSAAITERVSKEASNLVSLFNRETHNFRTVPDAYVLITSTESVAKVLREL